MISILDIFRRKTVSEKMYERMQDLCWKKTHIEKDLASGKMHRQFLELAKSTISQTDIEIKEIYHCAKGIVAQYEYDNVLFCDSPAEEMEEDPAEVLPDNPEDIDGKELGVGDRVSFTIAGPDEYNEIEGIVTLEGETYCVQSGDNLFIIDTDLLELKLLEWNEEVK